MSVSSPGDLTTMPEIEVPTEFAAMARVLEEALRREVVLEVEGKSLVWNQAAGKFEEVRPQLRERIHLTLASLEDFPEALRALRAASPSVDGPSIVRVTPAGVVAVVQPWSVEVQDLVTVPLYVDPLAQAAQSASWMGLDHFIEHLDRLGPEVVDGESLASLLRCVKVEDVSELTITEVGAYTQVRGATTRRVSGTTEGQSVEIPKALRASVPIGERGGSGAVDFRLKVAVDGKDIRVQLQFRNAEELELQYLTEVHTRLASELTLDEALVVRAETFDWDV